MAGSRSARQSTRSCTPRVETGVTRLERVNIASPSLWDPSGPDPLRLISPQKHTSSLSERRTQAHSIARRIRHRGLLFCSKRRARQRHAREACLPPPTRAPHSIACPHTHPLLSPISTVAGRAKDDREITTKQAANRCQQPHLCMFCPSPTQPMVVAHESHADPQSSLSHSLTTAPSPNDTKTYKAHT